MPDPKALISHTLAKISPVRACRSRAFQPLLFCRMSGSIVRDLLAHLFRGG